MARVTVARVGEVQDVRVRCQSCWQDDAERACVTVRRWRGPCTCVTGGGACLGATKAAECCKKISEKPAPVLYVVRLRDSEIVEIL